MDLAPDSVPIELFEAKFSRPLQPNAHISREHLLERLDAERNSSVVTLFAAPGSGKTTLLTQWVDSDERDFVWLTLDERDNDPTVLFTYLAMALAQLGDLDRVFESLRSSTPVIEAKVVPRIVRSVIAIDKPLILVLDDVHVIHDPSCLDAIATLITLLPPSVQIAIAGRAEPAIALPRLRAQGVVVDIGAEDLAFTEDETRELLHLVGPPMSEDEVSDISDRTEGWAVGVYLAALSMRAGRFRSSTRSVSGADRYVGDYMRSEFLDHLSPKTIEFLTRSAALNSMSGPLCDAVLHRHDSARTLDSLSRENTLVLPQDDEDQWYRYHHLFQELLLVDLEKREPGQTEILQSEAAVWHEANGERETALDYAQSAGDADTAARLFNLVAINAFRNGHVITATRWLKWFIDRDLEKEYPLVALVGAWIETMIGEAETATRLTALADQTVGDELLFDEVTSGRSWIALLKALACGDGIDQMEAAACEALSMMSEAGSQRGTALLVVGAAKLLGGDTDAAEGYLIDAVEIGARVKATHSVLLSLAELAIIQMSKGEWDVAARSVAQAREVIGTQHVEEYPTSALLYAVSAHLMAHEQGADAPTEDMIRTLRLRPHLTHAIPWLSVQARLQLGYAFLHRADTAGARTVIREAETILRRRPDLGVLRDQLDALSAKVEEAPTTAPGMSTLTTAELRLLPMLATHLTFPELGDRLFVSRHTVKSQAVSIYRKLGVSSRSGAVRRASDLGLLDN